MGTQRFQKHIFYFTGTQTLGTSIGHVNLSPIVLSLDIPDVVGAKTELKATILEQRKMIDLDQRKKCSRTLDR